MSNDLQPFFNPPFQNSINVTEDKASPSSCLVLREKDSVRKKRIERERERKGKKERERERERGRERAVKHS